MFLFFMLYHLMLSGNFKGSQIQQRDFFGVKFWSRDSFWGLFKPQGIFSGFDCCPHSIIPVMLNPEYPPGGSQPKPFIEGDV